MGEPLDEPFSELAMLLGRAFYEELEVIVLDKLVHLRQALTDRELADVLHLSEKNVHKGLVPLLRDRLVSKITRKLAEVDIATATAAEYREHQRTLGEVTSYVIELGTIPDIVKYKLHMLRKRVEKSGIGGTLAGGETTTWRCAKCDLSFSDEDTWRLFDDEKQVFTCECGEPIEQQTAADADAVDSSVSEERRRRLEATIAPLLVALGRCDKELEEGREPPPILRAAMAAEGEADASDVPGLRAGSGAGGARGRAAARQTAAENEPSLTVEMDVTATPAAGVVPVAGTAGAQLFWQSNAAESARKRTREQEEAAAAAEAEAARAAQDERWAAQLRANQQRQQRELARGVGAPLPPPQMMPTVAPPPPAAGTVGGSEDIRSLAAGAGAENGDEWEEATDVFVSVQGVRMRLSEVTDEDTERMTSDEYKAWYELSAG